MKRFKEKILRWLNDLSLVRKFVFIYLVCIMLPFLLVNTVFIFRSVEFIENEQTTVLRDSLERVTTATNNKLEDAMVVLLSIYSDGTINNILEDKYTSNTDYYNKVTLNVNNAISKNYLLYQFISSVIIYADNDTMINGGDFMILTDKIRQDEWYVEFQESSKDPYVRINNEGQLQIIKRMGDINSSSEIEKIVVVNVDLSYIDKLVEDSFEDDEFGFYYDGKLIRGIGLSTTENTVEIKHKFGKTNVFEEMELVVYTTLSNTGLLEELAPVVVVAVFGFVIATLGTYIVTKSLSSRIYMLKEHAISVSEGKYLLIQGPTAADEIGILINDFNTMTKRINTLITEVYEKQIENQEQALAKTRAELNALQSQVNPHFIYNVLNTIRMKSVLKNEDETAVMLKYVARLIRKTIRWDNDIISLHEELQFVEEYLKIQKYRFEEKLDYNINMDENAKNVMIPKMFIQILVENASVHGIEKCDEGGSIEVFTKVHSDNRLYCKVRDTGYGMSKNEVKIVRKAISEGADALDGETASVGLGNLGQRLKYYYGDNFSYKIKSEPGKGTEMIFILPNDLPARRQT